MAGGADAAAAGCCTASGAGCDAGGDLRFVSAAEEAGGTRRSKPPDEVTEFEDGS